MTPDIQPLLREREAMQVSLETFKELISNMDAKNELPVFLEWMLDQSFFQKNQKGNN